MQLVQMLIDKAVEACHGNQAELARKMGIDRAEITRLRSGKRPLSPELAAEIADIAGEDARQAAIDAIIERNAANRKGVLLREILGKAVAAGVVGVSVFFYSGDSISATAPQMKSNDQIDIGHIVSSKIDQKKAPRASHFKLVNCASPEVVELNCTVLEKIAASAPCVKQSDFATAGPGSNGVHIFELEYGVGWRHRQDEPIRIHKDHGG